MSIKTFYDKIVDSIYNSRENIIRISLSSIGIIVLLMVFYLSSDKFNINSEVDNLLSYIENRQYSMAENYYDDIEKDFSASKMNRFNKKVSKKLSSLLMNKADMYINGKISKEQYMALVNIVNQLNPVVIDGTNLIDLGKRVVDMYKEENITYDAAENYLQITSSLNGINQSLAEYKQNIKVIYESRKVYKEGRQNQGIKKYHEAIELYNKVIEDDSKYYSLAQTAKKECIEVMYDYYMSEAKHLGSEGRYEDALKYLSYLIPYYDEEEVRALQDEYNEYVANYTMTSDDIISLICRRSKENKNNLTVISYLQTIDGKRYYYGEVLKNEKVINEVLVDTETKALYSYKSDKKDYKCNYSDAYFKVDEETGSIILSIDKNRAQSILEDKLQEKEIRYKKVEQINSNKTKRYKNTELENQIKKNGDIYYYFTVKTGWFKSQTYVVNMYSKKAYFLTNDKMESI